MSGPRQAPSSGRPDPVRLARIVTLAYFEVRAGRRSWEQLRGALSPAVLARLRRQVAVSRLSQTPDLRRIVTCWTSRDACELTAIVAWGDRVTAIAMRLERHQGLWRVTELAAPEEEIRPLLTASRPDSELPDSFDLVRGGSDPAA